MADEREDDRIINICFHGIGTPRRELEPGEDHYWIGADEYQRILDELLTWPSVRISFDDSNASDVEIGLPGLLERGLHASFFVLAGRLGRGGSLDEADVRELTGHGMAIGTHGMNHRSWRNMDPDTGRDELVAARERLAAVAGADVDQAACPLGQYDRRLLAQLRRLGYRRVFTSDRGRSRPDAWLQPRFSVRSGDTAQSLRAAVRQRPPLARRARSTAVGFVKRWR